MALEQFNCHTDVVLDNISHLSAAGSVAATNNFHTITQEATPNDAVIAFSPNAKRYLSKMLYPIAVVAIFACMMFFTSNAAKAETVFTSIEGELLGYGAFSGYAIITYEPGPWIPRRGTIVIIGRTENGVPFGFSGSFGHPGDLHKTIDNILASISFDFRINGNLEIYSNVSGICSIYELESGNRIVDAVPINISNTYQAITNYNFDKIPYFLQFTVDNKVVYQQSFYYFNNTTLKGVQNENN
jgi:hypothetical protein